MADTLLTEGDATTTTEDGNASTEDKSTTTTTEEGEGVIEKFDADGKPSDDGEFDKDGKKIEVAGDDKGKDKDGDEETGAPESYADYTLPEGIEIAETDLTEFNTIAKELDLNQDQAQRLVDYQSKRTEAANEDAATAMADAINKQAEDWVKELKDDPDFGGDNLDKNIGLAVKVTNKFGSPELKAVLTSSGMGNNPELIKMFNKIGKAFAEDSLDPDAMNSESGSDKTAADVLYPNQGKG